jgi:hypothetical protein
MDDSVSALAIDSSDNVYAGGNFTTAVGVPDTKYIAKWNAATSTWTAMGTGMNTNGYVWGLTTDSSGNVYTGGGFIAAGGVAVASIAKWDVTATPTPTWTAMGTGMNGNVSALTKDSSGNVYAGGSFAAAGGVSNTSYIAKWNGTAWTAMGTGMNSIVSALTTDSSGNVYGGGSFSTANGKFRPFFVKWSTLFGDFF